MRLGSLSMSSSVPDRVRSASNAAFGAGREMERARTGSSSSWTGARVSAPGGIIVLDAMSTLVSPHAGGRISTAAGAFRGEVCGRLSRGATKLWRSSACAEGRSLGSMRKHSPRKPRALDEMPSGSVGGALAEAIWNMRAKSLERSSQGGAPVSICTTVQPRDQMSAALPCPCCRTTSGAMNCGVPSNAPLGTCPLASLLAMWLSRRHELKSASFTMPSSVTKRLPPFTSQCTIPWEWR
mmetsp:Transcript_49834/g.117148  ORF Transcript_49834/g.117148 Transcript_49834/m.117148 type:complete len:239 (-) Transcript_49834:580-1296(-)